MKGFIRGYPLFSLCGLNCGLCTIVKTLAAETHVYKSTDEDEQGNPYPLLYLRLD